MALVKLEIDGKRVIADSNKTILEVARENGIQSIPTLCHDDRLEPFASCFVCVVKVKGARSLLPACSTRVSAGMVVETNPSDVRQARKAALELLLSNHYADCVGPCQLACPAGVDIQGYVALAALGKYNDAIRLIKETNPLPAICGRVCTRPCEVKGCRRSMLDEAVGIDYIKRYVADLDLGRVEPFRPPVAEPTGKSVAVIGAGPAGLACAYYLAQKGHTIQMFEALPEAGGMLRYGIPEYRLPKEVLDMEVSQILDLGIKLSTNVSLGKDFTIAGLKEKGFNAIFLGIGAWDSSKMRVQNEEVDGVLPGIDFLKGYGLHKPMKVHGRVLVVGGGNTAIDCARTAMRLGASEVHIVYRRTRHEMPANEMEIHEADQEGVIMDFLVAPVRVITENGRATGLECMRMELGEPDASGRRSPRPVRGSEFVMPCDFIIAAIGQGTKIGELINGRVPHFLPLGETLNLTRWGTVNVNERTFETSVDGVFAGGDLQTGAATVVEAVAAGRKAAYAIDSFIMTGKTLPEPRSFLSKRDTYHQVGLTDLKSLEKAERRPMPILTPEERRTSFVEVEQGYTSEDLKKETTRCLECGCQALFSCDLRRYATEYDVDITPYLGEAHEYKIDRTHPLIELDPNKCILCGRCVRICSEVVGVSAYGFINRGFSTVVMPSLGGSLLDTGCVTCGLCLSTCPTGAITQKLPLSKPGPWLTETKGTVCQYCGVGCSLNHEIYGDTLVQVSGRDGVTQGNHCRKGRFGFNYVQAADRLLTARVRRGTQLEEMPLEEALQAAGLRLRELRQRYTGQEMAVFVSPRLTNEEAFLAQKFARVVLGTHQVSSFARLLNPALECPEVLSTASYPAIEDAQTVIVLNANPADEHFVVDIMIKKALRKGAQLIFIGPAGVSLTQYTDTPLSCPDGAQPKVLLALLLELAALGGLTLEGRPALQELLAGRTTETLLEGTGISLDEVKAVTLRLLTAGRKIMLFNKDYRGARVAGDERIFAQVAELLGAGFLALREKSNMQGILDMGVSPSWLPGYQPVTDAAALEHLEKEWCVDLKAVEGGNADLASRLEAGQIKVAIVLGEDPLGFQGLPPAMREGLQAAELLVVGDLFLTETAKAAHVVLPLSSVAETGGTMTNQERRVQVLEPAVAPANRMATWEVITQLAARAGFRFRLKYADLAEVQAELRRLVPLYDEVLPSQTDARGQWERARATVPVAATPMDVSLTPIPAQATLFLDPLESRFEQWFQGMMTTARERLGFEVA